MDSSVIERKIEEMEKAKCLSAADYALLRQWARHSDALIRDLVASVLVLGEGTQGSALLLELTEDTDALVRADAYDSLSVFCDQRIAARLRIAAIEEPADLARYFAIVAYADVMQELVPGDTEQKLFFQRRLEQEQAAVCRLGCEYVQYRLGEPGALERILGYLNDSDYLVRCRAVCTLEEVVDEENRGRILEAVRGWREQEGSAAVRERIDEWIRREEENQSQI